MRNLKKKIISSVLAIGALMLVGTTTANAATYNTFVLQNSDVVCTPESLEKGGRAECYLIGKPVGADANSSVHGYVMHAYTTKYLKLVAAQKVVNTNTNVAYSPEQSGTETLGQNQSNDRPDSLTKFSCNRSDAPLPNGADPSSFACGVFYTVKSATSNAFTPTTVKNTASSLPKGVLPTNTTDFGAVGKFIVSLSEDVKGNECGEVCVKAWRVPEATMYENKSYQCTDGGCGVDTLSQDYDCIEVHYTATTVDPGNTETGAFASYALLAAGALIAISAVTLAKKNNKFSRI